ncbi:polyprenyl synthetase family protein [Nonomuraea sp. NBC_01738]|uniref:polyprenyl synthetase family protein n=1 Tax=Nonomuraea sp. NBC_01738 TaxID=2976003 RepID=UPI002E15F606|nr:polyprenyl synthetase family protein [Nonomuraea sp. NBC_01738]
MHLQSTPAIADGLRKVESTVARLGGSSALPAINEAAERVIHAGGKRLRPALTLATALAFGKRLDRRIITAAACVELIHAGSLVHDDLMDGATQRRGIPTLNADLGRNKALVIGDFMLARAGLAAVTAVSRPVAEVFAATTVELAEGQFLETADLFNRERTQEAALRSITGKTAALFRASCLVAAICARAETEDRRRMAVYGERFGLIFQILDDLLDLAAPAGRVGKPTGHDLAQGVYTLPILRARARDPHLLDGDVNAILAKLNTAEIVEDTLAYCRELADEATAALPALREQDIAATLRGLPHAYLDQVSELTRRTTLRQVG